MRALPPATLRRSLALVLALATLAAGCARPDDGRPATTTPGLEVVDAPPDGGGPAPCASSAASRLAVPMQAEATRDAGGRPPGIHRLDARAFLWVWAAYEDTLRDDRVTRIDEVTVDREPDGRVVACMGVNLAAPQEVDATRESYAVAVLVRAPDGLPPGPLRVVVNWIAGCLCDPLPSGNATADFD